MQAFHNDFIMTNAMLISIDLNIVKIEGNLVTVSYFSNVLKF